VKAGIVPEKSPLQRAREAAGLTVEQLAEKLSAVADSFYSRSGWLRFLTEYEAGETRLRLAVAPELLDLATTLSALGRYVTIDELLGRPKPADEAIVDALTEEPAAPPAQPDLFVADVDAALDAAEASRNFRAYNSTILDFTHAIGFAANAWHAERCKGILAEEHALMGAVDIATNRLGWDSAVEFQDYVDVVTRLAERVSELQSLLERWLKRGDSDKRTIAELRTQLTTSDEARQYWETLCRDECNHLRAQLAASEQRGWRELSEEEAGEVFDSTIDDVDPRQGSVWATWYGIGEHARRANTIFANACIRAAANLPEGAVTASEHLEEPGTIGFEWVRGEGGIAIMLTDGPGTAHVTFIPDTKSKPDLTELSKQARELVDAMTEDELRDMLEKQGKSFARGQVAMTEEDRRRRGE
jgi:transcriptional regulator with XRE-family HTH domain